MQGLLGKACPKRQLPSCNMEKMSGAESSITKPCWQRMEDREGWSWQSPGSALDGWAASTASCPGCTGVQLSKEVWISKVWMYGKWAQVYWYVQTARLWEPGLNLEQWIKCRWARWWDGRWWILEWLVLTSSVFLWFFKNFNYCTR